MTKIEPARKLAREMPVGWDARAVLIQANRLAVVRAVLDLQFDYRGPALDAAGLLAAITAEEPTDAE